MKFIVFLLFFISLSCCANEYIDEKLIVDLLQKEKYFVQNKDIESYMSLIADDFSGFNKKGNPITKESLREIVFVSFLNASQISHNSRLKSFSISEDKQSADVILENDTKYLIERGKYKAVIPDKSITRAKLVLDKGILKYQNDTYME